MYGHNGPRKPQRPIDSVLVHPDPDQSSENLDDWDPRGPSPLWDDLWDAFELDDEMPEPEPEHGDFWGQLDDPLGGGEEI